MEQRADYHVQNMAGEREEGTGMVIAVEGAEITAKQAEECMEATSAVK